MGVEDLSPVQWHPFTSRAGPEPHTLLAHVKGYGPWTQVCLPGLLGWDGWACTGTAIDLPVLSPRSLASSTHHWALCDMCTSECPCTRSWLA